jgi:dinuclear metal center YbgI/SA1388 family protein
MLTVQEMMDILASIAPPEMAEDWDNPGLQIGRRSWPVRSVWVALDPLPEVVSGACREGVDLLITHHPMIFRPLHTIDVATPIGAMVEQALAAKLAVVAAHTNLDSAPGGLNDILAGRLGLENLSRLSTPPAQMLSKHPEGGAQESMGIGRIGSLSRSRTLVDLARFVKDRLDLQGVAYVGDPELKVSQVAVCTGSGASLLGAFMASGAQAFVSGDLRYHDARDAEAAGRGLIDIGHFGSEHFMVEALTERLQQETAARNLAVTVRGCPLEKDPFRRV